MAVVYVLVNPAFDNYVKIGRTANLEQRLRALDNTSVPLPFRCVYAVEVGDDAGVERLVHNAFADHRTRTGREFFEIDPQRVISALKLTNGRDVTPHRDIADDDEGLIALERAEGRRRIIGLYDVGLKAGDVLTFANDEQLTATVVSNKKVDFEGETQSISSSALRILNRTGYEWRTVNGWQYWQLDGETLSERRKRLEEEQSDDDD
ncbi:hypothetical protein shim_09790 [Shimia sp. SK013]|uniref:GIY-YIG nuclease family protein n=1 Tax=Shimia sp. SK013 TaxID=1389006 RepID=UPI0006CC94A5|nr:GIY-YIG nuclease family protein [Shimia sp. SK013]KPA22692.1 hypothetical protein shim_09790 [Shimia sp. SK013]